MQVTITVPEELWPRRGDWSGVVVEVYKDKGDRVETGEVIFDIEIEKAVLAIESPVSGVVVDVYVEKGTEVKPGDRLATIKSEEA